MKFAIAALIGLVSAKPQVTRILTDEGYVFMNSEAVHQLNIKSKDYDKPSDYLCDGDKADDKEVEFEHDPTDLIVDYNGHTNRGYAHTPYDHAHEPYRFDIAHYADNNIKNPSQSTS